jgi:hypothetical protein
MNRDLSNNEHLPLQSQENEKETIFTWINKNRGKVAIGTILVLAIGGAYVIFGKSGNKNQIPADVVTTTPTEQVVNTNKTESTLSPAEIAKKEKRAEVDQYEEQMKKYKDMTVNEFEVLPINERLMYADYLVQQTVARGTIDTLYSGQSDAVKHYTDVSTSNSGQEILDNQLFIQQVAYAQFNEGENQTYDPIDAQKVLSAAYGEVGNGVVSRQYLSARSMAREINKPSREHSNDTAVETSGLKLFTKNGEKIQYKIIK